MAGKESTTGTGAENQTVGKVFILYGTVKAVAPDGTERALAPNSPIFAHDQIITESDGSLSIQFDGPPVTQLDLGRMSTVTIDEDVYAGTTAGVTADAAAEAEQIQQALLQGDQPIDLEATAAGGDGGAGGGVTSPFSLSLTGAEVTPTSGAGTTGPSGGAPEETHEVNTPPVASDVLVSGTEDDTSISGAVTATDAEGNPLTYSLVGDAPEGLTFNADGTFSVVPLASDQALAPGESREVTFQYIANDGFADSAPATVTVTIHGVNDPAILSHAIENLTETDAILTTGGTLTIHDVDSPETYVAQTDTVGIYGTFSIDAAGNWTYTTDSPHDEFAAGQTYTDVFTATSADGTWTTVTVNILGTNDGAEITGEDVVVKLDETDAVLTASGTLLITDVDNPPTQAQTNTAGEHGTFSIDTLGHWTYTANSAFNELNKVNELNVGDDRISDHFTVISADGTVETSVTIIISGTNDVPVVRLAIGNVNEGAIIEDSVARASSDADAGETATLTYALVNEAPAGSGLTFHADGSYEFNASSYEYLAEGERVVEQYPYTATDVKGAESAAKNLTIIITGTNDVPTIVTNSGNESGANDVVYESALENAHEGRPTLAYGSFKISDVDGLADIHTVTINGTTINIADLGHGNVINGEFGTLTITGYDAVTAGTEGTGAHRVTTGVASYTYELTSPTTGEFSEAFTLTTSDGIADSAQATITVEIVDDGIHTTAATLDDEGLPGGISDGVGDVPGELITTTGTLPHDFGAGGTGSIGFAAMDAQTGTVGVEIVAYHWNAETNTLTASSEVRGDIFTVEVTDPATGSYELTLLQPVIHEAPGVEGSFENNAVVELTYTATDATGYPVNGTFNITINDDMPVVGENALLNLNDHALDGGITGETLTGTLAHAYGADGAGKVLLTGVDVPTEGGFTSTVSDDGRTLTIFQDHGSDGSVAVQEIVLADDHSGNYEVTQLHAIAHTGVDNNSNVGFTIQYQVMDTDGDTAHGTLAINVADDMPTVATNLAVQLDDDALAGNAGGIGDVTPDTANLAGTLSHSYGADSAGTVLLTGVVLPMVGGFTSEVSADGLTLTISQDQGGVEPVEVQKIMLADDTSGNYEVTQLHAISHPEGFDENNVDFTIQYQVMDSDGDAVPGTLTITINDDTPVLLGVETNSQGSGDPGTSVHSYVGIPGPGEGGNTLVNGLGGDHGFGENFLPANDDGSTGFIDVSGPGGIFPDGMKLFGQTYDGFYINNNGNITFENALGTYTPFAITGDTSNPMIAPFFADVDTRGAHEANVSEGGNSTGSNLVWYDMDHTNGVITITWDDVGYYSGHTDHVNAFQLRIFNQGDQDFSFEFRYENVDWTVGDVSGVAYARAGWTAGDGENFYELPQSGDQTGMLGLETTSNLETPPDGNWVFNVVGGEVTFGGSSDTVIVAEDKLPDGTDDLDGGVTFVTGTIVDNVNWGADGFGKATTFSVGEGESQETFAAGDKVYWGQTGAFLGENIDGPAASASLLVNSDGTYTYTLLDHLIKSGVGEQTDVLATVAITGQDADGDPVAVNVTLQVEDDTPTMVLSTTGADHVPAIPPDLVVDESSMGVHATADFSTLFTPAHGADDGGSTVYTLGIPVVNADTGLTDTLTGQAVVLVMNDGVVEGQNELHDVVFQISVDDHGNVTLDQMRAVMHDSADAGTDTNEPATLNAANLVTLTATITDGDGDAASTTANIGTAFSFLDDGPSASGVSGTSFASSQIIINETTGNLLTDSDGHAHGSFGADGGHVTSLEAIASTEDPHFADVRTEVPHDYDLQVIGEHGGELKVDSDTGDYIYTAPRLSNPGDKTEIFQFTLIDADGDTASAQLSMLIDDPNTP